MPVYIVNKDNELREIKGDKLFLGLSKEFNVTTHTFRMDEGDTIYLSTDGFPDQKGGEKGKKYYYSRMRNALRIANAKPVEQRKNLLDDKFSNWKGDLEQIDDVCVMGVRF